MVVNRYHPVKNLILFLIITLLLIPQMVCAASITLAWDANKENDLLGYKIYYGTSSGNYDSSTFVGNVKSCEISELKDSVKYYIAITALDTSGNESDYSKEITTKHCFSGITLLTLPPFITTISPCFNYTGEENRFTLIQEDSTVSNQVGDFNQTKSHFDAICEYDLDLSGEIIHYSWKLNGNGNASSNPLIFGNLTVVIETSTAKTIGMGIFSGFKISDLRQ